MHWTYHRGEVLAFHVPSRGRSTCCVSPSRTDTFCYAKPKQILLASASASASTSTHPYVFSVIVDVTYTVYVILAQYYNIGYRTLIHVCSATVPWYEYHTDGTGASTEHGVRYEYERCIDTYLYFCVNAYGHF